MKTKVCFKCDRELPISSFYKHPQMADGRLGKCKDCAKKDVVKNYGEKREQYSRYEKKRSQDPARKAKAADALRRHRKLHPDRNRARRMLNYYVRKGHLSRRPCELCGSEKAQGHHEDYSKPLDVRWLCFKCHREDEHGQVVVAP